MSLWGGISISNALHRAQRLQELSMLTKVTCEVDESLDNKFGDVQAWV